MLYALHRRLVYDRAIKAYTLLLLFSGVLTPGTTPLYGRAIKAYTFFYFLVGVLIPGTTPLYGRAIKAYTFIHFYFYLLKGKSELPLGHPSH